MTLDSRQVTKKKKTSEPAKKKVAKKPKSGVTYADAGVSIDAGNEVVRRIKKLVSRTEDPRVLHGLGGFAGLFALDYGGKLFRKNYRLVLRIAVHMGDLTQKSPHIHSQHVLIHHPADM